jgi:hypothetical protein
VSEEFFASDYVAQAEEFFWRATSTPRLARKSTRLRGNRPHRAGWHVAPHVP